MVLISTGVFFGLIYYIFYLSKTSPDKTSWDLSFILLSILLMECIFGIVRYTTDNLEGIIGGSNLTSDTLFGKKIAEDEQTSFFSLKNMSLTIKWLFLGLVSYPTSLYFVRGVPVLSRYLLTMFVLVPSFSIYMYCFFVYKSLSLLTVSFFNCITAFATGLTYSEVLNSIFFYLPSGIGTEFLCILLYEFHSLFGNSSNYIVTTLFFSNITSEGDNTINVSEWTNSVFKYLLLLAFLSVVGVLFWFTVQRKRFLDIAEKIAKYGTITEAYIGKKIPEEIFKGNETLSLEEVDHRIEELERSKYFPK